MNKFSITRRIEIDMAHRIPDHKSKCFNVHGHRYVIEAACSGHVVESGEQKGMVMDFGFLKDCMMESVHQWCDHAMAFYREDPLLPCIVGNALDQEGVEYIELPTGWKIVVLDDVPTAENLAAYWYEKIRISIAQFHRNRVYMPTLEHVTVWETPNCFARYPA